MAGPVFAMRFLHCCLLTARARRPGDGMNAQTGVLAVMGVGQLVSCDPGKNNSGFCIYCLELRLFMCSSTSCFLLMLLEGPCPALPLPLPRPIGSLCIQLSGWGGTGSAHRSVTAPPGAAGSAGTGGHGASLLAFFLFGSSF